MASGHQRPQTCSLIPISLVSGAADNWRMAKLAIRCHPFAPVAPGELERWLERLVDELRGELPQRGVRLSRLTQRCPRGDLDVGWLLELELELGEFQSTPLPETVASALTDMRLLGLQTTLFTAGDLLGATR